MRLLSLVMTRVSESRHAESRLALPGRALRIEKQATVHDGGMRRAFVARTWRRCLVRPLAVVVSGAPGSGKTTLARELSEDMRLPHLNKDLVCSSLSRRFERAFG